MSQITVLQVDPGKRPRTVSINNDLGTLQSVVGGLIEFYPVDGKGSDDDVMIICNEEGKLTGLPYNRAIYDEGGEMIEVIAGTFLVVYSPPYAEHVLSLTPELLNKYLQRFLYPEMPLNTDLGFLMIPVNQEWEV